MDFGQYVFGEPYFGWLCRGVVFTLLITALTTVLSLLLGTIVAGMRTAQGRLKPVIAKAYITAFRNIPPVPLLLFLVFAVPGLFRSLTGVAFPTGMEFGLLIAGLSLNTSAYIAEILRSGIRAVATEHYGAGRVLGLTPGQIRRWVIYPQAVRVALPALGTRMIHNMKNSAIALVLPLAVDRMEVVGQAGRIAGQTFAWAEPLIFAAAVHLTLAVLLGFVVNRLALITQRKVEAAG